jgi:hypothetical protein
MWSQTNTHVKMKELKITKQKPQRWVLPKNSLSQDEFLDGIRKAEKGPFQTIPESMENFETWLKSREKK